MTDEEYRLVANLTRLRDMAGIVQYINFPDHEDDHACHELDKQIWRLISKYEKRVDELLKTVQKLA